MSLWGDIRDRVNGEIVRKEDEYITSLKYRIKEVLSKKVGVDNLPIRMFFIDVDDDVKGMVIKYSITLQAVMHQDGSRDFYTEENVNRFLELSSTGKILNIQ